MGLGAPAQAQDQGQVTPGAFCSPQGATGHTSTGLAMTCTTTASDSRARWRQASTQVETTTTAVVSTTQATTATTATTTPTVAATTATTAATAMPRTGPGDA